MQDISSKSPANPLRVDEDGSLPVELQIIRETCRLLAVSRGEQDAFTSAVAFHFAEGDTLSEQDLKALLKAGGKEAK